MNEHAAEIVPLLWSILAALVLLIFGMIKMYLVDLRQWQKKQDDMHGELRRGLYGLSTRVAHIEGKLGIVPASSMEEIG